MTDETKPEQPPAPTEMEQLRDSVSALQTIVSRVREAVGTDDPTPIRESYRIRVLETRVSDAEYERNRARERAEAASRVGTQYMARAERAETAIERVRVLATRLEEFAENALKTDDRELYRAIAGDIRTQLDGVPPAPAATEATEATDLETTARVVSALHRSAEDTVTRVITLHEQWVKAGPPPLGAPLARWWDARLAELHNAIQPADQSTEK